VGKFTKSLAIATATFFAVSSMSLPAIANENYALKGAIFPIYLPDRSIPSQCTTSTMQVALQSGKRFLATDIVAVESSIEEATRTVNQAVQVTGEVGFRTIGFIASTRSAPTVVGVNVQLCSSELPATDPTYLNVTLILKSASGAARRSIKGKMPIVKQDPTAAAAQKVIDTCGIGGPNPVFGNNLVIQETTRTPILDSLTNSIQGARSTIQGTLFRNGVTSPGDSIEFFMNTSSGGLGKLLGKVKTDAKGQFSLTLPVTRVFPDTWSQVRAIVMEKSKPVGDLKKVFPSITFTLTFEWLLNVGYWNNPTDWLPAPAGACGEANAAYAAAVSDDDDDDSFLGRAVIAMYLANKTRHGYLGKEKGSSSIAPKSFNVNAPSAGSAGGYVYPYASDSSSRSGSGSSAGSGSKVNSGGSGCTSVSGHWRKTKKGRTWVNGHSRC
jgi:hypothetical protein